MSFTKQCPQCGKELSYTSERSLKRSIKNNSMCKSCAYTGRIQSEETKAKISKAMKGKKCAPFSEEHKRNMSIAATGRKRAPFSEEARRNMSKGQKGKKCAPFSEEHRRKLSLARGGDGILDKVWDNVRLAHWTKAVKERDNHTCQYCGETENLHAHHVFPKSRFPALAYDLNNGRTLCQSCHIEEHKLYATDYFKDIFQTFSDFA